MRVLILTHALPCHRAGGLERATWVAVRGLAERGHRVTIVTTPLESGRDSAAAPGFAWDGVEGVDVEFAAGRPGRPTPTFWRAAAREARRRRRLPADDARRPDVIYSVDTAAMLLRGVPFVLQLHGTLFSETTLHAGFAAHRGEFPLMEAILRYKARLLSWPLFGPMLRRAGRILTDSRYITELLAGDTAGKASRLRAIETLPLALDPDWARELEAAARAHQPSDGEQSFGPERPLRLLTVGRAARIKGHEVMARAVGRLLESGRRDVVWEIAGPPSHIASDLPSLRELEAGGVLNQLGLLEQSRLAEAFGRADYLLNLEYNQPAFGLVALEAFHAGCAPIVSNRGALPEVVLDRATIEERGDDRDASKHPAPGFVLPAGDVEALADLLLSLYDQGPEHAVRCDLVASERAKIFEHKTYIDRLERVLLEFGA